MYDDFGLIEASIAKQYGIRIRQNSDMPFDEFCTLISGLMPDTPLGQVVSIRAEKDPKVIKGFNKEQRKTHNDWKLRRANSKLKNEKTYNKEMDDISKMLRSMFKPKEVK